MPAKLTPLAQEIRNNLSNFYGSENFYAAGPLFRGSCFTEGMKYIAEKASAFWLIDAILSHHKTNKALQAKHEEYFWKLTLNEDDDGARLVCEDGNGGELASQDIPYTDFPLDKIDVWVGPRYGQDQKQCGWTVYLPSER